MTTAGGSVYCLGAAACAAGADTHERAFPARPEQVGEARRFVAGVLAGDPGRRRRGALRVGTGRELCQLLRQRPARRGLHRPGRGARRRLRLAGGG